MRDNTVARPYAKAIFDEALESNTLSKWSATLSEVAKIAENPEIAQIASNPTVDKADLAACVTEACGEKLTSDEKNFIHVIVRAGRLLFAPAIYKLYGAYRANAENQLKLEVRSAFELDESHKKMIKGLFADTNNQLDLKIDIDKSLMAGVVIHAGDRVTNISISGALDQLKQQLKS